jgi:predicted homoserine dehydrogenase-like protein
VRKLNERAATDNPVAVGIVGCGMMGSGLAHAVNNVEGMAVRAVADIAPQRGIDTFLEMGWERDDIAVTEALGAAHDALAAGKVVVTPDAMLMPRLEAIEANVEATGVPDVGASVAYESVMRGKAIVMLNVETDVTVGAYLSRMARRTGGVYTVASGDEPGVCKMLYEQARLMGFEVVCLGKGKNNPIDRSVTPDSCAEEAHRRGMNPKILSSFVDGTKTMVEMAAVSNATGLLPDVPGMHGPKVEVDELLEQFIPQEGGGLFERRGVVDYSTGAIAPGVFAIVYSDDPRIRKDMKFITGADGPYYLHFRPYHLCDLETPQSVAEAVLLGEVTVAPETMHSEVVAVAKRDLKAGETVGTIGGAEMYGRIYTYEEARGLGAIPIGIAEHGTLTADVPKGDILTEDNFAADDSTFIYRLRRMQDSILEREG